MAATDADVGINADLVYSIVLFFTGPSSHFTIDGATGQLSTAASLDRETTPLYVIWVRVTDQGTR